MRKSRPFGTGANWRGDLYSHHTTSFAIYGGSLNIFDDYLYNDEQFIQTCGSPDSNLAANLQRDIREQARTNSPPSEP